MNLEFKKKSRGWTWLSGVAPYIRLAQVEDVIEEVAFFRGRQSGGDPRFDEEAEKAGSSLPPFPSR